jgi:hypothetical protein
LFVHDFGLCHSTFKADFNKLAIKLLVILEDELLSAHITQINSVSSADFWKNQQVNLDIQSEYEREKRE